MNCQIGRVFEAHTVDIQAPIGRADHWSYSLLEYMRREEHLCHSIVSNASHKGQVRGNLLVFVSLMW